MVAIHRTVVATCGFLITLLPAGLCGLLLAALALSRIAILLTCSRT